MKDENEFWIAIWRTVGTVLCVVVALIGGCTMHKNTLRYDAIKNGADPMELSCAAGVSEQHICTLVAQRGRK